MMLTAFGAIAWDPQRNLFTIPWINHPVGWYGVLFACGFLVGYLLTIQLFSRKLALADPSVDPIARRETAIAMADKLCWYAVGGTVIGARLGHVFFYGSSYYYEHPLDIFKIWEGGLASHGGVIGVLIAFALYMRVLKRYLPKLTYLGLLDLLCIPAAFLSVCIRLGNFMNQEIVGTPTTVPWAVAFGHPLDGPAGVPLHPVQLYEAALYLFVFVFLYRLWLMKGDFLPTGRITGYLFVLVFGGRMLAECVKTPQGAMFWDGWLQIGQLLSLPFFLLGVALLVLSRKKEMGVIPKRPLPPPH